MLFPGVGLFKMMTMATSYINAFYKLITVLRKRKINLEKHKNKSRLLCNTNLSIDGI